MAKRSITIFYTYNFCQEHGEGGVDGAQTEGHGDQQVTHHQHGRYAAELDDRMLLHIVL